MEKSKKVAPLSESEKFILKNLISIFSLDITLIEERRNEKGMKADDPKRKEMSIAISQFSIPFSISPRIKQELKKFFKKKGWKFLKISSTPSIMLEKI